ncbi:MAG: RNA polymerase sigma factor [Tepidisphaeraceae bacterium]
MPPGKRDDPRTDTQIISDINAGDDASFEALYYRYRDWVVRLARRRTSNDEDALEVLQETFAYLARKFPGFQLTAAMTSFLYPVVTNLSIAARRESRRFQVGGQELETSQERRSPDPAGVTDLAAALSGLPGIHREVVLLRFVDDLSLQEISDALSLPLGTVKSRLHYAIGCLRHDPRARKFFEP